MNVYGKITVISNLRVKSKVFCLCECGNEKWINIFNLMKGDVKSCGCLKKERMKKEASKRFKDKTPSNFNDYTGKKIGLITVVKRIHCDRQDTWYLLKCECDSEFETSFSSLRRSKFKRCLCGYENHPLKRLLRNMIDRCTNINNKSFQWYGNKGINVWGQWIKFPIKFIKWSLENNWKEGLTIDRIDSSKGYSPENCQWITKKENAKKAAKQRWEQKSLV